MADETKKEHHPNPQVHHHVAPPVHKPAPSAPPPVAAPAPKVEAPKVEAPKAAAKRKPRPTPTQEEANRASLGESVHEHEDDGSPVQHVRRLSAEVLSTYKTRRL